MKFTIIALIATALVAVAEGPTLEEEKKVATERIETTKNLAVVAVDGLCCKSCAIGVGKKVRKLDFVDLKSLDKGIAIDKERFLLEVALKDGKRLDHDEIVKAIRKAGYEPARIYERDGEKAVSMTPVKKKK